jgi:hypothetical protein
MSLTYDLIPDHDGPTPGAGRTGALRALPAAPRRAVLRAAVLGAMTLGAAALDWTRLARRRPARAETGRFGLAGWDRTDCRDAYPDGYPQVGDTGGAYLNTYAACFGGSYRGSNYCDAGWHKYGTFTENGVRADHVPISTACGTTSTRNAWRWTTPDGVVYRCSDGFTTYYAGPVSGQTFLTICRAVVQ